MYRNIKPLGCAPELTECCSQLYFKNKQVHRKRLDLSLLEVRRGVLGGELEEPGQRVQTSRAPPSRVRQPAGASQPSWPLSPDPENLEGAPGPKHPPARPPRPETPRGAPWAQLPPPDRQPVSRCVLPSMGSPETCPPAGDRSTSEGHTPAAKKEPLLPPATLSSSHPPIPSSALRVSPLLPPPRPGEPCRCL